MITFSGYLILIGLLKSPVVIATQDDDVQWSLQQRSVCFGSAQYHIGRFKMKTAGLLKALKFEHTYLRAGCDDVTTNWFRCHGNNNTNIEVRVSDENKKLVLPASAHVTIGRTSNIGNLQLVNPIPQYIGKKLLHVRHGKRENDESDSTKTCFDVYAKIIPLPKVSLTLRTTSCRRCNGSSDAEKCPSSIMVNNEEESTQQDGVNVLVIAPNMTSKKTVVFKSYSDDRFGQYMSAVKSSSIVVIVLQNACIPTSFRRSLYKRIGLIPNASKDFDTRHDIAIIVYCKDKCVAGINKKISSHPHPFYYYYFGNGREHTVMLPLVTGNEEIKNTVDNTTTTTTTTAVRTIIICVITVVLISVLLVLIYVCKYKHDERKRVNKENKPRRVPQIDIEESTNDAGYRSTKHEDGDGLYSALSDVITKSVEHIYAYVDPQTLKGIRNDCKPPVSVTTSRQTLPSSGDRESDGKSAGYVAVEGSTSLYMAPSSLPKFDSTTMVAKSSNSCENMSANQYEVMTGYSEDLPKDVTYEEISSARAPRTTSHSGETQTSHLDRTSEVADSTSPAILDDSVESNVILNPLHDNEAAADQYMTMGLFTNDRSSFSNESPYVSLLDDKVEHSEPLYQTISTVEYYV